METVIKNEIVRVKGKVKAITVPKEKTQEVLRRVELRILDKKYEALMPPLDNMENNNIDLQGMMTFMQEYLSMLFGSFPSSSTTNYAQIVITTTSGSQVQLNYANTVTVNSQGVTTVMQIFGQQNSMNVQYYYIGFDTTNNSYQGNYLELYSTSQVFSCNSSVCNYYKSNLVRIAYANLSVNKQSNYDLFILWMIEFQNVPSYLIIFIPVIPNPNTWYAVSLTSVSTTFSPPSSFNVYANNGNCNFTCNGNCPSSSPNNFMISVQNDTIVLQIPVMVMIGGGTSSAEILMCENALYYNNSTNSHVSFSSSYSTTIAPPSSGYIFFALLAVIAMTFTVS